MKVIIIGGVAAGMSAASKLRRLDKEIEIVVYEKGEVLSYGACGMPYFISDEIKESKSLIARTKFQFEEMGIKVFIKHEVIDVNDENKTIKVLDLDNNIEKIESFDKLIIGSGASPIKLDIPGKELNNILSLSTLEDGIKLKELGLNDNIKDVTIVGAGFIGLELVETFVKLGKNVTLVEYLDQVLPSFDEDITKYILDHILENKVNVYLEEKVVKYEGSDNVSKVITNKREINTDLVIEAIGIKPNTYFLKNSNIELLKNGAVKVNDYMETNVKDIYAAGDCASIYNKIKDTYDNYSPMGHNANKQGRVIAENIAGNNFKFNGVLGTTVIKVLDIEAGKTGITEKEFKALNLPYEVVKVKGRNKAHYYPGSDRVSVKIIYDPKTKVIKGAQIVGKEDAALRIDIFAVAIFKELTTDELGYLDLAYAPPFAGVWDVVQIAANKVK